MRYHLSTFLLLLVIIALSLGWYRDRQAQRREFHDVVGIWQNVLPDQGMSARYRASKTVELLIDDDGSFSMRRYSSDSTYTYHGRCQRLAPNLLQFHITSKTETYDEALELEPLEMPVSRELDMKFMIEYSLAADGRLNFDKISAFPISAPELADRFVRWDAGYRRQMQPIEWQN
jgi:hypothetical protein